MNDTPPALDELVRSLWYFFDAGRFQDVLPLLSKDFDATWPNTRERIVGLENFVSLNETYPGRWRCTICRLDWIGSEVMTVTRISDGSVQLVAISFFKGQDGLITSATEYFADMVDPPYDRSRWAERY